MCDPLGKNLLLPSWYVEDFKEESSASSLGMLLCVLDLLGKNILLLHWRLFKYAEVYQGRIFCLIHRDDVLDMLDPLGKNILLSY